MIIKENGMEIRIIKAAKIANSNNNSRIINTKDDKHT